MPAQVGFNNLQFLYPWQTHWSGKLDFILKLPMFLLRAYLCTSLCDQRLDAFFAIQTAHVIRRTQGVNNQCVKPATIWNKAACTFQRPATLSTVTELHRRRRHRRSDGHMCSAENSSSGHNRRCTTEDERSCSCCAVITQVVMNYAGRRYRLNNWRRHTLGDRQHLIAYAACNVARISRRVSRVEW